MGQVTVLARDPFFLPPCAVLCLRSLAAVILINNPNHSVLDAAHLDEYEFSRSAWNALGIVYPVDWSRYEYTTT